MTGVANAPRTDIGTSPGRRLSLDPSPAPGCLPPKSEATTQIFEAAGHSARRLHLTASWSARGWVHCAAYRKPAHSRCQDLKGKSVVAIWLCMARSSRHRPPLNLTICFGSDETTLALIQAVMTLKRSRSQKELLQAGSPRRVSLRLDARHEEGERHRLRRRAETR